MTASGKQMDSSKERKPVKLPKINKPLIGGFHVFNRRYLRKNFHSFAVNRQKLLETGISPNEAAIVYANHASWWDPLTALFLCDNLFSDFRLYAPIDAEAFEKYKVFGQMGFYPVDQSQLKGAAHFLKVSREILKHPGASIWITPEGRFADVRDDSTSLMPGLGHLAASVQKAMRGTESAPRVWFIPLAVEYAFWEEKQPELLASFGEGVCVSADEHGELQDKSEWLVKLTANLRQAQRDLATASIARDSSYFEVLLSNSGGTFFIYDWYRKVAAKLRGKQIDIQHSDKLKGAS